MPWEVPPVADFENRPEYRWPNYHLGLDEEDLYGDLHSRFNTMTMFIQDPMSFHHDVAEIAGRSHDKQHFYKELQQRRDERLEELNNMHNQVWDFHISGFTQLDPKQNSLQINLLRCASLDSLVAFCASLLGPRDGKMPTLGKTWLPSDAREDEARKGRARADMKTEPPFRFKKRGPREEKKRLPNIDAIVDHETENKTSDDTMQSDAFNEGAATKPLAEIPLSQSRERIDEDLPSVPQDHSTRKTGKRKHQADPDDNLSLPQPQKRSRAAHREHSSRATGSIEAQHARNKSSQHHQEQSAVSKNGIAGDGTRVAGDDSATHQLRNEAEGASLADQEKETTRRNTRPVSKHQRLPGTQRTRATLGATAQSSVGEQPRRRSSRVRARLRDKVI